jgi:very-short-patch-repair endonuclease
MSWPYREIAAIADGQQGQVAHRQLTSLGARRGAIAHSLKLGRIYRTFAGVYAVGDRALPPLWREMGAVLTCGEDAFVSRHWAVAAWGVRPAALGDVDVTVPYGRNSRRTGVRTHRSKRIDPRDVTVLKGVPIATPAFALLETAAELSFPEFERAFDDALTRRAMSLTSAQQMLARHQGCRGAPMFALLARPEHGLEITRSRAEQLMKGLAHRGGLTGWRLNWRRGRIIPDMLFDVEKVIVEVDGFRTHGARRAFEDDRARDAKLAAHGWIVLRFTWRQLTGQPELVLVRLAQTLAIRRAA